MADEKKKAKPATELVNLKDHNRAQGAQYVDLKHDQYIKTKVKCDDCDLPLMAFQGAQAKANLHPKRMSVKCFGCLAEPVVILAPDAGPESIYVEAEA